MGKVAKIIKQETHICHLELSWIKNRLYSLMTVNIIKSTMNSQAQSVLEANMLTAIHFFSW